MLVFLEQLNAYADKHETEGGTCKTITINGTEIRCCLDENGNYKSSTLGALAFMTHQ